MKRILIVDDDQRMLDSLRRTLHRRNDDWAVTYISNPQSALEALRQSVYDAVVTDIRMPGMDGWELLDHIRDNPLTKDIPVVVLTGLNDRRLKQQALERGAADLLHKPIEAGQLIARLHSLLQMKTDRDDLRAANDLLSQKVRQQSADLAQSRLSIVCRLGMAAEYRDEDTGNHVIRVGCFSRAVAAAMGLPRSLMEMLLLAAPLHDIGKIGIPDSVLLKPGPLTDEEWATMQRHCEIGWRILSEQSKVVVPLFDWYAVEGDSIREALEKRDPALEMAASIALAHHEKWDGGAFPRGLSGVEIALDARIVAVAEVFAALSSNRPYRGARPEDEALSIMQSSVGSHFDPVVYNAFMQALPEIREIRARFADEVDVFPQLEGAVR